MASEREIFGRTGPYFLSPVDWNNSHHRRSVAASLVQGVYTIERDRQNNRQGPHALAPPWWEFFNFKLIRLLTDEHDISYFGAIFENKSPIINPQPNAPFTQKPPQFVIAFRGTIKTQVNRAQDFKLNLHCILNNLENSTRFNVGIQWTKHIVGIAGQGPVWLAGHSLGSSIALSIGRNMIKTTGAHLETYLFNPPFMSPPIERLKNENLKMALRFTSSVITAGLAMATSSSKKTREIDPFVVLSSWVPYLFLNPEDPICSEYCGYFDHRERMEAIGAGKIGRLATQHSIGSIVSSATKKNAVAEAMHLIPSAYLTINASSSRDFKEAHGIHQWWRMGLQFKYKLHQYRAEPPRLC